MFGVNDWLLLIGPSIPAETRRPCLVPSGNERRRGLKRHMQAPDQPYLLLMKHLEATWRLPIPSYATLHSSPRFVIPLEPRILLFFNPLLVCKDVRNQVWFAGCYLQDRSCVPISSLPRFPWPLGSGMPRWAFESRSRVIKSQGICAPRGAS
jgi:hypothetical protein